MQITVMTPMIVRSSNGKLNYVSKMGSFPTSPKITGLVRVTPQETTEIATMIDATMMTGNRKTLQRGEERILGPDTLTGPEEGMTREDAKTI